MGQPGHLLVGELDRPAGLLGREVALRLALHGELGLQCAFEGPGDQPFLRLDRVVLPSGAVGLETGPFGCEAEDPQRCGVGGFRLVQGRRGGLERSRGKDRWVSSSDLAPSVGANCGPA